jgi:hypothetical protein
MTAIATASSASSAAPRGERWLFSKGLDVGVFGGSAFLSLVMLAIGKATGAIHGDAPDWAWVPAVLLVDVAHVWGTGFRVYFEPKELRRRPLLYAGVPVLAYLAMFQLYAHGTFVFWRCLAYLAIFHFVRQQAGWVALYRARARDRDSVGRLVDTVAIYAATVYPLAYWHTHKRSFDWFTPGNLVPLPLWVERVGLPIYLVALGVYAVRSLYRGAVLGLWSPGKDLVVGTTALCWYVGIIAMDSDYAFTVMNVFIHGIPYIGLIYAYGRSQEKPLWKPGIGGVARLLATLWALAYIEELGWDRSFWGERSWLFGTLQLGGIASYLVPLLAVPQVTHYILDGFIWRRADNPGLAALFPSSASTSDRTAV